MATGKLQEPCSVLKESPKVEVQYINLPLTKLCQCKQTEAGWLLVPYWFVMKVELTSYIMSELCKQLCTIQEKVSQARRNTSQEWKDNGLVLSFKIKLP